MKYIIALIVPLAYLNPIAKIQSQNLTCEDLKIGKFELIDKETNKRYIILRDKNYQVDQTFELTSIRKIANDLTNKIHWKNDCEYSLMADPKKNVMDEYDLYVNKMGGLHLQIKEIEGKCYTVETTFNGVIVDNSFICKIGDS
jgi:hypothetical protein